MSNEMFSAPAPIRSDDQISSSCCMGAHWKEQLCFGSSKEAKESNISDLFLQKLDETRFILDANLLREALEITPIDQAHQFVSPPSGEAIMDFVNELGYTECLTSKTYEHDRPRYPVLHMLWGIIRNINFDYVELMWEEFVQAMQTFLTDKANLGSPTKKCRKDKPHVIPYCQFTMLIIYHLGRIHNIHQRSESPFHLAEEDLKLGNLKFVSKCEIDEVFGMLIPNELISNNIRNASYYNAYLEMVVKHDQKVTAQKEEKKKPASTKQSKPKPASKKSSKPAPAPKQKLVNEPDKEPAHSKPEPEPEQEGASEEYDMNFYSDDSWKAIRPLLVVEGKGKAIVTKEQAVQSLLALHTPKRRSTIDQLISKGGLQLLKRQQLDPLYNHKITHLPILSMTLLLQHMLKQSLKFLADEHIILEDPLSSTETLSSMKNLEDAYVIGDQFINGKSTDDEPRKLNVEAEVVSMVTVLIYQASSSAPPLSTLVINLSPKNASSTTQTPVFTATTTTIKTPLPPPPQQQSTTESELAEHVATLEKKLSDLEQTNKNLDNTTQNLRSWVYTLELKDLPHKIIEAICKNVKDVVQIAL
ncbi:hypothetical protein Tco_0893461 [Tanacetum coccineum]|uniref:Uncharacterized protein n=1 Tax=Tanacetum coccineum TaxID=301880 RepID=A0ABQ5CAE6_9ASTR